MSRPVCDQRQAGSQGVAIKERESRNGNQGMYELKVDLYIS